jgi:hypothetical protein
MVANMAEKTSQNEIWPAKAHIAHGPQIFLLLLLEGPLFIFIFIFAIAARTIFQPTPTQPICFNSPHNSTHYFSSHSSTHTNSSHIEYFSTYNYIHIIVSTHTKLNSNESTSPQMVAISQAFHIPQVLKCSIITSTISSIHILSLNSQVSNFNMLLHPEQ